MNYTEKEREEVISKRRLMERVHELTKENLKLKAQLPNDEEFNNGPLCEQCDHCCGFNNYTQRYVCELQEPHCKHYERKVSG